MTEPIAQPSLWMRLTWKRPQILKVHVYPGRTRMGWTPPDYDEWIIAWGGKWRWRVRRA